MSVSTESMQPERLRHLDESFSAYVAQMVCLRPTIYIKTGEVLSLIDNDPPTPDKRVSTCRSCNGSMRGHDSGRVFCSSCRAGPLILEGAPLIDTMYRSAHPKYVLGKEAEALVAHIGRQREIAAQSQVVSRQLAYQSYNVYENWRRHKGDRNVYFTPESVLDCSYAEEVTHCNPRYIDGGSYERGVTSKARDGRGRAASPRHVAVTVGGLGLKMMDVVKQAAVEWLYNLDAMIRSKFQISLERRHNDSSVLSAVDHFATLIAKRVVLLEEEDVDDPEMHLCTRAFEQAAKIQFVTCEHYAARLARADILAMRELVALVRHEAVPPNVQPLVDFLGAPCAELLKSLPTVATDMRFAELRTILLSPEDCAAARITRWSKLVGPGATGALHLLLSSAIESTQKWSPVFFLHCLRHDACTQGAKRPLPAQGWVDNSQIAHWSLVSAAAHARRRTGLDPTGLRIVLMSSALMQLNADGGFFVPGVMRCEMVHKVCTAEESLATYAYNALSEQLWPYMTGAPWKTARAQLINWQGSHVDADVRRAAAVLGGFSVEEIAKRFLRKGSALDQMRMDVDIVRMTTDKMICKPRGQYEQWFPMSVELLLPILQQLRQSAGIASGIAPSALSEVLRLLRPVREWQQSDGVLTITAGEAYHVPEVKSALHRLKGEGSPLIKYKRPTGSSVMCWVFDTAELVRVLNK